MMIIEITIDMSVGEHNRYCGKFAEFSSLYSSFPITQSWQC